MTWTSGEDLRSSVDMGDPKKQRAPHALEDLVGRAGKNNPKMLEAIVAGTTNDALVKKGGEIGTPRILVDGLRLYGEALDFFDRATPEQKKTLRGVSPALVCVAIHHLDHLRQVEADHAGEAKGKSTARNVGDEEVARASTAVTVLRDQAYSAMKSAAGGDTALVAALDDAYEKVDPPAKLAIGVEDMAALLRKWLKSDNAGVKLRLQAANLDGEYADELSEAALDLQKALAGTPSKAGNKASQHALDREDGVQILLLGQIIRAFENGHDRDATIPRLVPIATRRLFNKHKGASSSSSSSSPAAPPAP